MAARVIDFDKFREEQKAKQGKDVDAPVVRVGGKDYTLPPDLPATIAVDVIRLNSSGGPAAKVDPAILMEIGTALFGEAEFREILTSERMGVRQMGELIMQAFRLYDPDEGKETVPNRATRRQRKRST